MQKKELHGICDKIRNSITQDDDIYDFDDDSHPLNKYARVIDYQHDDGVRRVRFNLCHHEFPENHKSLFYPRAKPYPFMTLAAQYGKPKMLGKLVELGEDVNEIYVTFGKKLGKEHEYSHYAFLESYPTTPLVEAAKGRNLG